MIRKTVTYDDYNDVTCTEDFYFNLNKLEMMELEIKFEGGLDGHLKKLTQTDNAKDAYYLFKDIVLSSYGVKDEDGKGFVKSPELSKKLEQSPALSELILEFLQSPTAGAAFIEGCLPKKLVAEVQAAAEAAEKNKKGPNVELPTAAPVLEDETPKIEEKKPQDMTREELLEAMRVKNQPTT